MMAQGGPPAARDRGSPAVASEWAMRVVSGVVLAAIALTLNLLGVWAFAAMVLVGGVIAAWEWGRLVRGQAFDLAFFVHSGVVVLATVLIAAERPIMALAVLGVGSLGLALMVVPGENARWSLFGLAYVGLPAMALVYLRTDPTYGWQVVILLFTVVWATDTAAFVVGRYLRGPKLWPSVSPKKTWSGCIAGLVAGGMVGACWGLLLETSPLLAMALVAMGLALAAQAGDLVESAAKRAFDHKDMSQLIPGHGGMLDRVDSLIFASLAAAALALLRDAGAPGAALMVWQ